MVDIKRSKKVSALKVKSLDTLLVNYTKDPDNSNTSEAISAAISEYPDIYPDSVEDIEGLTAYYDHLLNGPRDRDTLSDPRKRNLLAGTFG